MIELIDIHKHYGFLKANNGVTLTIPDGTIHAVLGENGAGKSTLMKIMSGYVRKSSGRIRVDGVDVDLDSPTRAVELGIGMLYQDPMDFPQFSVLDNFIIGSQRGIGINRKKFLKTFQDLSGTLGFSLPPDRPLRTLTIGERQQLEIMRLLSLGVRVLILDEPTTGITDRQKATLFSALRSLAGQGKSVVLVSHKIEDVQEICDSATVLRRGNVTGSMDQPFDTDALLGMMFESQLSPLQPVVPARGDLLFSVSNLSADDGPSRILDVTLDIYQGEIVGLAGLEGSGQETFLKTSAGIVPAHQGSMILDSVRLTGKSPLYFQKHGVALLPGSRLEEGLISGLDLVHHALLNRRPRTFFLRRNDARNSVRTAIDSFKISAVPDSPVETLSGGNQQRFLLSLLPPDSRLLLLDNPTRGLDIVSSRFIWDTLKDYVRTRRSTLIFSSPEIDEILAHADRVIVFFNGRVMLDVPRCEADSGTIGKHLAGLT